MRRCLYISAALFMLLKFSESRLSYNGNMEYLTKRMIPISSFLIMYLKGCSTASNQPVELANERTKRHYIENKYCETSISFYLSYFILYFCDDKESEKNRRRLVRECLIKKIDDQELAQPRKEELLQKFDSKWPIGSVDNHESDFYLAMDFALIKIALETERKITDKTLSIKSMSAALLTHYFFKDIMTLKLMLAEKMVEMAQSEHLCPCIRNPDFFGTRALQYMEDMKYEKMEERYLTCIPSVDVNVFTLFYDTEGEFLHPALMKMRDEIKKNVHDVLLENDVMVQCLADLFFSDTPFTTTELNPGSAFPNEKLKVISKDAMSVIYNLINPNILKVIDDITGSQNFNLIISRGITEIIRELNSDEYKVSLTQHKKDYEAAIKELEKKLEESAVEKMTQAFAQSNPSKEEESSDKKVKEEEASIKKAEGESQTSEEEHLGAVGGHE